MLWQKMLIAAINNDVMRQLLVPRKYCAFDGLLKLKVLHKRILDRRSVPRELGRAAIPCLQNHPEGTGPGPNQQHNKNYDSGGERGAGGVEWWEGG